MVTGSRPKAERPAEVSAWVAALCSDAMVYLNHAGTSWPKPRPVREAVREALEMPVEQWDDRLARDHRTVAAAFGIDDPARLLLTPGCTSALAVAVADLPWQPGDRALTSAWEHHALIRPLRALERRGVELTVLPGRAGEPLDRSALEHELRRGRVRLLALTAACNVTGELLPVAPAIELAHAHGASVLVDAAQAAGWIDVDVRAMGADLLAFAGHKGPQAPWGVGGLYVAPGVAMATPAASCGTDGPGAGGAGACVPMPGACDVGSVDRLALAGLAAGLQWLASPERADRLTRGRAQIRRLASACAELPGVRLLGAPEAERRLPTLALALDDHAAAAVPAVLAAHGVTASSGLQCAPLAHHTLGTGARGALRFSVGPATPDAEIERAGRAMRAAVAR